MRSDESLPSDRIVALYHASLLATLDDPEEFLTTFTRAVQTMLPVVGILLVAEPRKTEETFRNQIETIESVRMREKDGEDLVKKEATGWIKREASTDLLEEVMARGMERITEIVDNRFPDRLDLVTHWITIDHTPRFAICFFRPNMADGSFSPYSPKELDTIDKLTPHISTIVRLHLDTVQSRRAGFDFFAERCHMIATEFSLTLQEYRVLRKLVAGASNAEISEEIGTSPATVKTHITHILQKTGCRNRSDLIGKHFSSRSTVKI